MGDTATKEALEWALGCTDAVRACAEVTRFMNDLASFKVQITCPRLSPILFIL
uniref:Terpene synthase metal-binding domain-containing protein n=1 Tax=Aegilops tauschii subsp. strangulata TaxID=200361 RepID=A0A453AVG1_AEGTS